MGAQVSIFDTFSQDGCHQDSALVEAHYFPLFHLRGKAFGPYSARAKSCSVKPTLNPNICRRVQVANASHNQYLDSVWQEPSEASKWWFPRALNSNIYNRNHALRSCSWVDLPNELLSRALCSALGSTCLDTAQSQNSPSSAAETNKPAVGLSRTGWLVGSSPVTLDDFLVACLRMADSHPQFVTSLISDTLPLGNSQQSTTDSRPLSHTSPSFFLFLFLLLPIIFSHNARLSQQITHNPPWHNG